MVHLMKSVHALVDSSCAGQDKNDWLQTDHNAEGDMFQRNFFARSVSRWFRRQNVCMLGQTVVEEIMECEHASLGSVGADGKSHAQMLTDSDEEDEASAQKTDLVNIYFGLSCLQVTASGDFFTRM